MREAKHGDTVKVHFTGKVESGEVFCSTAERGPARFRIGDGIGLGLGIQAVEDAVIGMNAGETREVHVPADEAFGPRREELVFAVERRRLPRNAEIVPGQPLEIQQIDGSTNKVQVIDATDSEVTVDGNRPLAGEDVVFEIQLVEVE